MRYEFIVKDAVPGDVAVELPELRRTSYPTGGTSLFGPYATTRMSTPSWPVSTLLGSLSSKCGGFPTSSGRRPRPEPAGHRLPAKG